MYLDPGTVGMFIQGLFALIASALVVFKIPRKLIDATRRLLARVRG
jgi:hypothetical protein